MARGLIEIGLCSKKAANEIFLRWLRVERKQEDRGRFMI